LFVLPRVRQFVCALWLGELGVLRVEETRLDRINQLDRFLIWSDRFGVPVHANRSNQF
jgi:hypothetical protein